MQGLILKSTCKWYQVLLEDGQQVQASIRGKLRLEGLKTTNPIAAGDHVKMAQGSDEGWPSQAFFPDKITLCARPLTSANKCKFWPRT